jgi:hypothetical protein
VLLQLIGLLAKDDSVSTLVFQTEGLIQYCVQKLGDPNVVNNNVILSAPNMIRLSSITLCFIVKKLTEENSSAILGALKEMKNL